MSTNIHVERLYLPFEKKCGEITIFRAADEITLHCLYCIKDFGKIESFFKHITTCHMDELDIDVNSNSDNELEENTETFSDMEERDDKEETAAELFETFDMQIDCDESQEVESNYDIEVLENEEDDIIVDSAHSTQVDSNEKDDETNCKDGDYLEDVEENDYNEEIGSLILRRSKFPTKEIRDQVMFEIIEEMQKHPNVWDIKHEDFTKTSCRTASFSAICDAVREKYPHENINREYIRRKITVLRSIFHDGEEGKGMPGHQIYHKRLSFLRGRSEIVRKTIIKPNENGCFTCPICSRELRDRGNLSQHIRRHRRQYNYKCEICDKEFYNISEYRTHQLCHTNEKPYVCEHCGKKFRLNSELQRHIKRHLKQRDYKCHLCPKAFYRRNLLTSHMNTHADYRPEVCQICQRAFYDKRGLKQHAKLHSEVKEYQCGICHKEFAQAPGLACHMKTHIKFISTEEENIFEHL